MTTIYLLNDQTGEHDELWFFHAHEARSYAASERGDGAQWLHTYVLARDMTAYEKAALCCEGRGPADDAIGPHVRRERLWAGMQAEYAAEIMGGDEYLVTGRDGRECAVWARSASDAMAVARDVLGDFDPAEADRLDDE